MKDFAWGQRSQSNLDTCDEDLQLVMNLALERCPFDLSVLWGHRTVDQQQELYRAGRSKKDGIEKLSKHQSSPSTAIDVIPVGVDWTDSAKFYVMAGVIYSAATELGLTIRYGGDWDSDFAFNDQTLMDLGHFEIVK